VDATPAAPADRGRAGQARRLLRQLAPAARASGLVGALLLVALTFHALTGGLFLTERNIPNLLQQASVTMVAAMGVALVIITRHIDLSIGSAAGLCAIIAAWCMKQAELSVPATLAAVLAVGLLLGALEGLAVAALQVPSFVVTLAGLLVFRGVGLVITEGNTIGAFPQSFQAIGQGSLGPVPVAAASIVVVAAAALRVAWLARSGHRPGVPALMGILGTMALGAVLVLLAGSEAGLPVPVAIAIVVGVVLAAVAYRTRFGRHLFAVGGNPEAAELAGISVRRSTVQVFLVMGALYALAGVMLAARLNGAPPEGAPNLELDAIAGAVIGGTSLMGGTGSVGGAALGALLMAGVSNGLSLLGVQSFYQLIATGLILVLAVALDVRLRSPAGA
jgi:ABC-type xylose transport system permease subunit